MQVHHFMLETFKVYFYAQTKNDTSKITRIYFAEIQYFKGIGSNFKQKEKIFVIEWFY